MSNTIHIKFLKEGFQTMDIRKELNVLPNLAYIVFRDNKERMAILGGQTTPKIDTVADIAFVAASMVKILPTISIPVWLWIWGALIAAVKICTIILGYASKKQFISLHTAANKITGLLMFLLPFTLPFAELRCILIPICVVATFAAIQELVYVSADCNNK